MAPSPTSSIRDIKIDVVHELQDDINHQIKALLKSRIKWRVVENYVETSAHLLMIISSILAFASGIYKDVDVLSFLAGIAGVTSIACLKFANYAKNECLERNNLLHQLLDRLNIKPTPSNTNVSSV